MTQTMLIDENAVRDGILRLNINRVIYFSLAFIPVTIVHIILFVAKLDEPGSIEYTWRIGIILSHSTILLIAILLGFVAYRHKKMEVPSKRIMWTMFYVCFAVVVFCAVVIVGFDQLVTPAITPYLVICIVLALAFILKPKYSLVYFVSSYVLFFLAISWFQKDPDIALSNYMNGLTAAGLGFFLSWALYQNTRNNIRQGLIIERQSKDLENRNQELEEQSKKLEHAVFTRDRFLSIISHDLKTPFNALLGFSDILIEDWTEIEDEEKLKIVQLMKETSETTYQLLLNLLDWSRIQKEQLSVRRDTFRLRELVETVISQLQAQASLKEINIELQIDPQLEVFADAHMITSIIRNLLSNAIKFSSKSQSILIKALHTQDGLLCSVTDHGVGMTDEQKALVFSKITSTSGTYQEQGTGLGLQLCSEFVRLHNGRIWVESAQDKGSAFYFTIPSA